MTAQSTVHVFTARACAAPLRECVALFEKQTGFRVEVGECSRHCASANAEEATGTAGGDDFLQEIAEAGIYDLAIAGAEYLLDDGEVRGIIAKGRRRFIALRRAAILVPTDNPHRIAALADVAKPGVRVAVSVLDCLKGLWEDVCGRAGLLDPVRKNITFYANGCIAIVEAVAQHKVDAAFGWTAFEHLGDGRIAVLLLPEAQTVCRATSIGMLAACKQPDLATRLMDFLATPQARAVYARYGWV
jgi:molybdate transport system substrate-binding protein